MRPLIGAGSNGDPPCTRSQDYYKMLLQLLLRMRFDLILWLLVEAVVQLGAISKPHIANCRPRDQPQGHWLS